MAFLPAPSAAGGSGGGATAAAARAPGDHRLALLFATSLGPYAVNEAGKLWLALPEGERAAWRARAGGGGEYEDMPPLKPSEGVEPPAAEVEALLSAQLAAMGLLDGRRRRRRHVQRPPPFMRFARAVLAGVRAAYPHEGSLLVAVRIGEMWRALPALAKLEWVLLGQGIE